MLSEQFLASISTPSKTPNASLSKDAGIFLHEYQPLAAQKHVFKKSATAQHCLAANDSHIFAAQLGKSLIHVYSREKGNQEAIVPFQGKIYAVKLISEGNVLALGTESGRLLLWEVSTGRLVTAITSHLQEITCIEVDSESNFLLTGSADSVVNVWLAHSLLSFASSPESRSPVRAFTSHNASVTALVVGQSSSFANIAVSSAKDDVALIWNYQSGELLRTYLLGRSPLALHLDPADRGFYAGYNDGSVQLVELHGKSAVDSLQSGKTGSVGSVVEPPASSRWSSEASKLGAALSLTLSWDSTVLISGHESGKIVTWNIAQGSFTSELSQLPGPVTNLQMLPPAGFPKSMVPKTKLHTIVKPRPDLTDKDDSDGSTPGHYSILAQLISATPTAAHNSFAAALAHHVFPDAMLEASLGELDGHSSTAVASSVAKSAFSYIKENTEEAPADFMSVNDHNDHSNVPIMTEIERINELEERIAAMQRVQKVTFQQLRVLRKEKAEAWRANNTNSVPELGSKAISKKPTNGLASRAEQGAQQDQPSAESDESEDEEHDEMDVDADRDSELQSVDIDVQIPSGSPDNDLVEEIVATRQVSKAKPRGAIRKSKRK